MQQNYFIIFPAQPAEKKTKVSEAPETDACLADVTVGLCQSWTCTLIVVGS